ncbi:MAG: tRNA pseudouridine(38-40) synthase TruA [Ignavibacteriaceae bacterium]
MKNYRLIIQYDGTRYHGWQIQKNAVTIQQKITEAIEILTREKVLLTGSGRTDTGVHALGQVANFKTEQEIDIYKFTHSLNAVLPADISVLNMDEVPEDFNARFDAIKRSYLYLITEKKMPMFRKYIYYYRDKLDCSALNNLSLAFLGEHDFTSFSKKTKKLKSKVCTVYNLRWRKSGDITICYIEANRFLHNMVRMIIGTLLEGVKNRYDENYIYEIFNSKDTAVSGDSVPAKGLFLYKVRYEI